MKSAYQALGWPSHATDGEIEEAFERCHAMLTPLRMLQDPGAAPRLIDIHNAYWALRDPAARLAHDRALSQGKSFFISLFAVEHEPTSNEFVSEPKQMLLVGLLICAFFVVSLLALQRRYPERLSKNVEVESSILCAFVLNTGCPH